MCIQEGLHQIDLLSPAETKVTQAEYMAQKSGQKKLEETNKKIIADGLKPTATTFQTQKQELRNAIEECSSHSKNFQEFQSLLLEKYQISVIEERGRYRYLHPDKRITEKALGTQYGKEHLEQLFLRKNPITILYVRSHLRLVVDLQKNVKAMQSPGYAHRVKISNLQEMANTIIYVQEHGYNTQTELKSAFFRISKTVRSGNRSAYGNECRFEKHQPADSLHRTIFCTESNLYRIFKSEKQRQIPKGTHR